MNKIYSCFKTIVLLFIIGATFLVSSLSAQSKGIPDGYYNSASGLKGYTLKTELYNIIKGHTDKGYGALYDAYEVGDTDPDDGFLWDMYSENPGGTDPYNYTHKQKQCGNYSGEADCYNREHLMPQSVFNKNYPMRSDYFHVIPSDGYVNGKRSNYAFGEVDNASWTSQNGSKVGPNTFPGYNGTVFEPLDEYKGDIARSLLYFGTRYETQVSSWSHSMLNGTSDQVYADWFLELLLQWHTNDPVSTKETVRNDAGYDFQGNRNPFVDHPEFVNMVWSNETNIITNTKEVLNIYPVPNKGVFYVSLLEMTAQANLTVYNILGKVVYYKQYSNTNNLSVDLPNAKKGIYFLSVKTEGKVQTARIIIE